MSAIKGKRLMAASEKAKENEILNVSKWPMRMDPPRYLDVYNSVCDDPYPICLGVIDYCCL